MLYTLVSKKRVGSKNSRWYAKDEQGTLVEILVSNALNKNSGDTYEAGAVPTASSAGSTGQAPQPRPARSASRGNAPLDVPPRADVSKLDFTLF